ncbi:PHD finger protein 3 [Armadillidium vulgare]|nr:PHD finger protein 3 [Armadillidium vulgare]
MSSSFVKDCSNASGSSSGNKTFIIIVSNETGNLNLNENQLQSLLATHGADASSQVSVMQMGGGGNANSVTASVPPPEMTIQDSNISSMGGVEVPTLPLNFMLEGFPTTIPVEGVGGGYAELPLDADALQRLENVLHTEEAKQILGGPLLDIVKDPTSDHLEKLISSSSDSRTDTSLTTVKKKRPAPKRRSQRQMDKAEREEVEKILAENQLMLQKEREELQRIQMEQEQQRIQMEQEQQRIEGEPEKEEETDDDNEDDSEDSDDSESDSEVDDIEKDTTFKLENDLKKGKKPKPAPKEKLKAVAVKKNATISVGKGKTGGGKKGPDDTTGKGNVSVKKPPNTGGGKGKGTGGKKVPTGSVMKQKGGPKSSSNKKGKIISSAVVKPKKGTAITKKKVAGVAKKTPKSIGKKLLAKPKTTTVKKRKQNIKNEELVSKEEKEEEDKTDIKIDKVSKDEAISPTSHRQADGSQARTPDKSAWNEQTDSYKKNSVHGMPNFNYSDDSSVKEISKKTRNKMQNDVEVLNPKEVLNFEVANTNYQIDVGDSSFKETNDPKMDCKSPCSSVDGVKNLASKKKASFENELNRGTFVSNKFLNAKFRKPNNKKVSSYSPTIPKSLKNFKIPLKNSVNKRPPLISQLPAGKPYEHLKTSSIPSHNSFISSPLDSFSSHSSPHDNKNTGSQIISNNNNNINVHKNNTHIADDSHTPVTSKKTPVTTNNNNMLKSDEKNDHLLSNLNFTPQKNNESNKIFKKSQNLKIVKKSLSNLDSSFKVESKIGNKDSSSNKAELETSISPNVFPLKNKNIEKMSEGQTIIRRSRRPIKKKTFGDDILFLDEKTRLHSDDFDEEPREEVISNDEDNISNESDAEEDDDNDFENEVEDDDPERLWCICEKPHNNRFMICCDRCEDWFHGSCVGVTKSMGKQMEQRKVQWICPNCKKAERAIKGFSSPKKEIFKSAKILPRSPEVQITNEISLKKKEKSNGKISKKQENDSKPKEKTEPRVLVYEKSSGIVLSGTSAPTLNILPDWLKENPSYTTLQPAMMNSIQTDPKTGIKRINLEAFGLKPAKPKIDRSFSFQEKIDSVPISSAKKEKMKSSIKLLKHSEVLEIEKGKKAEQQEKLLRKEEKKKKKKLSLSLSTESPSPKKEKRNSIDLSEFYGSVGLKKTPVDKLSSRSISLSEETAPSSPSSTKKSVVKDFVRDGPLSKKPGIKSPEAADKSASQKSDTMKHRESVRKFLYDALHKRKSEVPKEFKDLTDENLKLLCKEIEEQFFMTFNKDVGLKYKTRCRSLIFNIKDSKNGGLFRQILSRTIPPEKLANMTSEELASKELAEWREREEKKELEAIQKHELERIALGNQYIMKSHKGEIVIDKEDLGTKSKDTESVISLAPDASKAVNSSVDTQEDEDTINHRNHIYNPSCKICQASELQNISKEELLEAKEELNIKDEEDHKEDKERRKSTTSRRESESSSSHHHSKHKKKEKERERDRSRERRHSHKSKDKDRERDKDRHRDRGDKDKEKSRRHRHSSGDKDRSRRHRSRERQSREKDSTGKDDSTKDEKKSEDRKRRHSGSRNEDRKRHIEEIKDEIKEEKGKKIVSDTELLDISIKFKGSSSEDSKSPLQASDDPNDSHSLLPLDILLPPLPPLPIGISELATLDNKSQENQDRSPATPPYPIIPNDNDYDDDESMLSPATPPLPDDDDDDEDRLTPPPPSLPAQKPLEDVQIPIWKGVINMPDVAKFSTAAFENSSEMIKYRKVIKCFIKLKSASVGETNENINTKLIMVSGKALFFTGDVPSTVEVVGRISPDTVWTYIAQVKKSGSKEILVVRFQPSCEEEKVSYIALYSYLSSKKRYGVIGNCEKALRLTNIM